MNNNIKYFTFSNIPSFDQSIQRTYSYTYKNKKHDLIAVQSYYNVLHIDKQYRNFLMIFRQSPGSIIGLKNALIAVLLKNIPNNLDKTIFLILLSKNKRYNLVTRAKVIGIILRKSLSPIKYLRFKAALRLVETKKKISINISSEKQY